MHAAQVLEEGYSKKPALQVQHCVGFEGLQVAQLTGHGVVNAVQTFGATGAEHK